ncbi:MAG TPA: YezD family protein [Planctomycetaceae bacterium]|nr:YezD family protein [Planctomycetaceae bacterium]
MNDLTSQSDTLTPQDVVVSNILDALRGLRFGSIVVTVQDGVVVQIDRTEKRRLTASCSSSPTPRSC